MMTKSETDAQRPESATARQTSCPDHGHRLVPIHRVSGGHRVVVGWTCPEPYCNHVEIDRSLKGGPAALRFDDAR